MDIWCGHPKLGAGIHHLPFQLCLSFLDSVNSIIQLQNVCFVSFLGSAVVSDGNFICGRNAFPQQLAKFVKVIPLDSAGSVLRVFLILSQVAESNRSLVQWFSSIGIANFFRNQSLLNLLWSARFLRLSFSITRSIRQACQICSLLSLFLIFCTVQRSLSLRILLRQELRCLKLKRVYCTECLGYSPIKKDNTGPMLSAAKTCASSWICL